MDNPKPPHKPTQLLSDLESIRALLGEDHAEPPLLTDSIDPHSIPLLSEVVATAPSDSAMAEPAPPAQAAPAAPVRAPLEQALKADSNAELRRLDGELRAAAELILQDVIDDFVPQIEAELKRRLQARLTRLLPPRR